MSPQKRRSQFLRALEARREAARATPAPEPEMSAGEMSDPQGEPSSSAALARMLGERNQHRRNWR